jgi:hypothetical protein
MREVGGQFTFRFLGDFGDPHDPSFNSLPVFN